MREGRRSPGWVTMRDVAKLAEVSTMSVSRAFRGASQVNTETRARIAAAASELGYVPNLVAANLASGRSRIIGAIVSSIRNSNFSNMLQGLGDSLAAADLQLMLTVAPTRQTELAAVRTMLGRRPDGIVLTGTRHCKGTVELLREARIATVETWDSGRSFLDLAVGFDACAAARAMTERLIARGHRHIAYADYDGPQEPRFAARRTGFRKAMRAAGLDASHAIAVPESAGFAGGEMALEGLTRHDARPEGLFCVTDVVAAGAMFACARRGWDVPGRLAIAGFGDYEIAREFSVGLTTIRTRGAEIGATVARLLCERLDGRTFGPTYVDVGFEIVERGSA